MEAEEVQETLVAQEVQEALWGVLLEVLWEDQMVDQVGHLVDHLVDQEVGHSGGQCKGTHWQLALEVASSVNKNHNHQPHKVHEGYEGISMYYISKTSYKFLAVMLLPDQVLVACPGSCPPSVG